MILGKHVVKFCPAESFVNGSLKIIESFVNRLAFAYDEYVVLPRHYAKDWQHLTLVEDLRNVIDRCYFCTNLVQFYRVLIFMVL